jgi:DNA polymerase III delta prime subunit
MKELNVSNNWLQQLTGFGLERCNRLQMFDLRKIIIQNEHDFKGDYYVLMKNIFDQICDVKMQEIDEMKKKLILMEIGEYMYRSSFVADQEINFYCLLLTINKFIKN